MSKENKKRQPKIPSPDVNQLNINNMYLDYHPNIFLHVKRKSGINSRMITLAEWNEISQSAFFKLVKDGMNLYETAKEGKRVRSVFGISKKEWD